MDKLSYKALKKSQSHQRRMMMINKGQTVRALAAKALDNAKDRNKVEAQVGKAQVKSSGMGAIKQVGKTARRYITAEASTRRKEAQYASETQQKQAELRAQVQQTALNKWNGIINQLPENTATSNTDAAPTGSSASASTGTDLIGSISGALGGY